MTRDPASFAFARGGKDGTHFCVDQGELRSRIETTNAALSDLEIDRRERLAALKRLTELAPETVDDP